MHTYVDGQALPAQNLIDDFTAAYDGTGDVDANSLVVARRNAFVNHVISGLALPASSANLSITLAAGIIGVDGYYLDIAAEVITVTASKDTYIDVQVHSDGTYDIVQVAVANGATSGMTLTLNYDSTRSHRIGKIVSGASTITSTVQYGIDPLGNVMFNRSPMGTDIVYFPSLQNSWVNYDTNLYGPCYYYKTKDGMVYCDGGIKNGTTTTDTILFTLPVGFRPAIRLTHATVSAAVVARTDTQPDGLVKINFGVASGFLSLSGIKFNALGQ